MSKTNSFQTASTLSAGGKTYHFHSLKKFSQKHDISQLPFSLKILLENLLRNEDGRSVTKQDIQAFAAWLKTKIWPFSLYFGWKEKAEMPRPASRKRSFLPVGSLGSKL